MPYHLLYKVWSLNLISNARFEFLMRVTVKTTDFWVTSSCMASYSRRLFWATSDYFPADSAGDELHGFIFQKSSCLHKFRSLSFPSS
jgi:hypothetical protein